LFSVAALFFNTGGQELFLVPSIVGWNKLIALLLGIAMVTGWTGQVILPCFCPVLNRENAEGNQGEDSDGCETSPEQGTTLWAKFSRMMGGNLSFRMGLW